MIAPARETPKPDAGQLADAYEACVAVTKAASTNFHIAFQTLPPDRRNAVFAVYAFCRLADDIVDDPDRRASAREDLAALRSHLAAATAGAPVGEVWIALADASQRYGIREQDLADVIDGCEMDLTKYRYETFDELVEYCKRVASAVGLICIEVFGYENEDARKHAVDLGIAMQLTNVLRDIAEDGAAGRIYLPLEDLRRFGYSEEQLLAGEYTDNFRELMKFEVARARDYYESGSKLVPLLEPRSRFCPQAMATVYSSLLDRIEQVDYDVLSHRVRVRKRTKLTLGAKLWLRSRVPLFR